MGLNLQLLFSEMRSLSAFASTAQKRLTHGGYREPSQTVDVRAGFQKTDLKVRSERRGRPARQRRRVPGFGARGMG